MSPFVKVFGCRLSDVMVELASTVGCISDVGILLADGADLTVVVFSDDMGPHKRIAIIHTSTLSRDNDGLSRPSFTGVGHKTL